MDEVSIVVAETGSVVWTDCAGKSAHVVLANYYYYSDRLYHRNIINCFLQSLFGKSLIAVVVVIVICILVNCILIG